MSEKGKSRSMPRASRRAFLRSGAALAAGGAALPAAALAQNAGDADLARLQGRRRILLKGGVVL